MSQVSTPATPPTLTTLAGLNSWCQQIAGRNDQGTLAAFNLYLNQSQKDWEMEFNDHIALQRSQKITLTAPINGVPQDDTYQYSDSAPDFREERLVRIISPLNYGRTVQFQEYVQFRMATPEIALTVQGFPTIWYWAPEDPTGFHVWPIPDQAYILQFDYIAYAPELLLPGDTPFMDREFHKALGFQALFYYYMSDPINRPDLAAFWAGKFEVEKRKYMKSMQRRQIQNITLPYGTGVNEGRKANPRIQYFH